uniref:Sperm acrosome associated 7 n=1 Tax=Aotus nancymaae TaxID=37293 RepID=A0A2K5DGZ3_AOTNA
MAVSQGAGTLCFVLLLCCWQETELRPRTMTPGRALRGWLSRKRTESDEILVQEILDPNKTTWLKTQRPLAILPSKKQNAGIDENFQADGSENYHELLENLQLSSGTEDKISNDEASANANLHGAHSENYHGPLVSPGSEKRVSSKEKKNSKNTQYKPLSVLDKILQNMGRSSGNSFHKEQPRTSAQSRRPGGQ